MHQCFWLSTPRFTVAVTVEPTTGVITDCAPLLRRRWCGQAWAACAAWHRQRWGAACQIVRLP